DLRCQVSPLAHLRVGGKAITDVILARLDGFQDSTHELICFGAHSIASQKGIRYAKLCMVRSMSRTSPWVSRFSRRMRRVEESIEWVMPGLNLEMSCTMSRVMFSSAISREPCTRSTNVPLSS